MGFEVVEAFTNAWFLGTWRNVAGVCGEESPGMKNQWAKCRLYLISFEKEMIMNTQYEKEINHFFSSAGSGTKGMDGCSHIMLVMDKPNKSICSGTEFCNYEMRQLLLHKEKSVFYQKNEKELSAIINENSSNSRKDLNHLRKICKCWRKYIKDKGIPFQVGFSDGRLQFKS